MNNPFQQQFSNTMLQSGLLEAAIHIPSVPVTPAARKAKLLDWHKDQVKVVEQTHAKLR